MLKNQYKRAIADIDSVLAKLLTRAEVETENLQTVIYQINYQTTLRDELSELLYKLQNNSYTTINEYLEECYKDAHIGALYDMQSQGVPLLLRLNQEEMIAAITTNSRLSTPLYSQLGYNMTSLKLNVANELSRGVAQAMSYAQIARNLQNAVNLDYNKAARIVKTEGHRIQNESTWNAQRRAREAGAAVVKQWDSTLDDKTRPTHRDLDGQVVGIDEYFHTVNGMALYPGGFGIAREDCNCRCALLTRAEWRGDQPFKKINGTTDELMTFQNMDDYEAFKKEFWYRQG